MSDPLSQFWALPFWKSLSSQEDDNDEDDDSTYNKYYHAIRIRYVMGVQIMTQMQVKALVEKCNVSPKIVEMLEYIWLNKLVPSTGILADEAINELESQTQGDSRLHGGNIPGWEVVDVWYRFFCQKLPTPYSLATSFLLCHLAHESILPTDIFKWVLENKLPYFGAYIEVEQLVGPCPIATPLNKSMFQHIPSHSLKRLESMAASIALAIGLELPPVNFSAIASRYVGELPFSLASILPHACRICEWSKPPELRLSTDESRCPTRACVASILVVSIKMVNGLEGFGKWVNNSPRTQPPPDERSESDETQLDLDFAKLVQILQEKFTELPNIDECSKDFKTYLQNWKEVGFAGLKPSPLEDQDLNEGKTLVEWLVFYNDIEELWFDQANSSVENKSDDAAGSSGQSIGEKKRLDDADADDPWEKKLSQVEFILMAGFAKLAEIKMKCLYQAVIQFEKSLGVLVENIDH